MIQITRYMDQDELIWYKGKYIATSKWAEIEAKRIKKSTGKDTIIRTKSGKIAIYRERLKSYSN